MNAAVTAGLGIALANASAPAPPVALLGCRDGDAGSYSLRGSFQIKADGQLQAGRMASTNEVLMFKGQKPPEALYCPATRIFLIENGVLLSGCGRHSSVQGLPPAYGARARTATQLAKRTNARGDP